MIEGFILQNSYDYLFTEHELINQCGCTFFPPTNGGPIPLVLKFNFVLQPFFSPSSFGKTEMGLGMSRKYA